MSLRKNKLASMYYQEKCEKLEKEVKELTAANHQLDSDNKMLKAIIEKYSESSKALNDKYDMLVSKLKAVSDELNSYKERYEKIIKEAKIVAHKYKNEMGSFIASSRKMNHDTAQQ